MRDIAFPEAATLGWGALAAPFAFGTETDTIAGTLASGRSGVSVVRGGDGAFVLDTQVRDDGTDTPVHPRILHLHGDAGEVLEALELPAHAVGTFGGNPDLGHHVLLGSTDAPILYAYAGADAGAAWRVRASPLRLEPLPLPTMPTEFRPEGFERAGIALLRDHRGVLHRLDLNARTLEEVDTGPPVGSANALRALAVSGDADGVLVALAGPFGPILAAFEDGERPIWTRDVPIPNDRIRSLFRTGDGRVLLTLSVVPEEPPTGATIPVTVRYDPTTDNWSTAEGPCGALAGEGWLGGGEVPYRIDISDGHDGTVLARTTLRL